MKKKKEEKKRIGTINAVVKAGIRYYPSRLSRCIKKKKKKIKAVKEAALQTGLLGEKVSD